MSKLAKASSHYQRCLIISNGCGSGHKEAAKYVKASLQDGSKQFYTKEVLELIWGKRIAEKEHDRWAFYQNRENVAALNRYLKYQWLDHFAGKFWSFIPFLIYLLKNKIDHVITTQPVGLKGLMIAVKIVNFCRHFFSKKRKIQVFIILTELPTAETKNFFYPIFKLSSSDRKIFKLFTTKPYLQKEKTEEMFWKKYTRLIFKNNVIYDELPVREAFLTPLKEKDTFSVLLSKKTHSLIIPNTSEVISIMLGGSAPQTATLRYIKTLIQFHNTKKDRERYVFVFCGKAKSDLFSKIWRLIHSKKQQGLNLENLHIIPLSYQEDHTIAPILKRSNLLITKAGGSSAFEIQKVVSGKVFIHASLPKKKFKFPLTSDVFLKYGMPIWEAGNVKYLMHFKKEAVSVGIPETLMKYLKLRS